MLLICAKSSNMEILSWYQFYILKEEQEKQ